MNPKLRIALVVVLLTLSFQTSATSCANMWEHYVLSCNESKCNDGFQVYPVSAGWQCSRRLKVDDVNSEIRLFLEEIYRRGEYSQKSGIYEFSFGFRFGGMNLLILLGCFNGN